MKLDQINTIIECLLEHRNVNPYEFYKEDSSVQQKPKKRKNKSKSKTFVEDSEEELQQEAEIVDDQVETHQGKNISPWA